MDVLDYLHGDVILLLVVLHLHHLAEGALAQSGENLVSIVHLWRGLIFIQGSRQLFVAYFYLFCL